MQYFIKVSLLLSLVIAGHVYAKPLSLHDKIGQMLIMGFEGKSVNKHSPIIKAIKKHNIGGVILFDYILRAGII